MDGIDLAKKDMNRMQAERAGLACGTCQNAASWRSERQSFKDNLLSLLGWYPWECRKCRTRFYFRRRG
jgi:hypothetical protein